MKLTVSSTSMMNPILHTNHHSLCLSAPQRVLGLLEIKQLHANQHSGAEKLVQYHRPDVQHVLLQTAKWKDCLQLENRHNENCAAVFGFEFDGVNTWYQLWDSTFERAYWLLHTDDMNYEPFAILAMDALMTLIPNWDGTLYQAPNLPNPSDGVSTNNIDAQKINSLIVSDARTSSAGQLWFLVTVNAMQIETDMTPLSCFSGWISHSHQMEHIGTT